MLLEVFLARIVVKIRIYQLIIGFETYPILSNLCRMRHFYMGNPGLYQNLIILATNCSLAGCGHQVDICLSKKLYKLFVTLLT